MYIERRLNCGIEINGIKKHATNTHARQANTLTSHKQPQCRTHTNGSDRIAQCNRTVANGVWSMLNEQTCIASHGVRWLFSIFSNYSIRSIYTNWSYRNLRSSHSLSDKRICGQIDLSSKFEPMIGLGSY